MKFIHSVVLLGPTVLMIRFYRVPRLEYFVPRFLLCFPVSEDQWVREGPTNRGSPLHTSTSLSILIRRIGLNLRLLSEWPGVVVVLDCRTGTREKGNPPSDRRSVESDRRYFPRESIDHVPVLNLPLKFSWYNTSFISHLFVNFTPNRQDIP